MIDTYTIAFSGAITPEVAAALIGGLFGAAYAADIKTYGIRLTILVSIGALLVVGAVAEWLSVRHGLNFLWILGGIGFVVGMATGHLLDATRVASPALAKKLVALAGDAAVDEIASLIKRFFSFFKR